MRGVDLQTILYRMQEIDKTQTPSVQQGRAVQDQLIQQYAQSVQVQQNQVSTAPRTEGNKIRENEQSKDRRQGSRQKRRRPLPEEKEQDSNNATKFIDVRV